MVTVFMGSNIVTNSLSAIVVLAEMDEAVTAKTQSSR